MDVSTIRNTDTNMVEESAGLSFGTERDVAHCAIGRRIDPSWTH